MLDRTNYTTTPARTPVRVLSGHSIAKTKKWGARKRAFLAAQRQLGVIEVTPTIKAAAETFHVSVPHVMEALADLKADGEHLTKHNGNGNGNGHGLPFISDINDIWSHLTDDERETFVRDHLHSVWAAVENVT
jgi:hypothetical protein